MGQRTRIHVVVPTHTARHLDLVLVGLARQSRRADTIIVSCDTDDGAIGAVIERWAPRLGLTVHWVRRAHHGGERLSQVRNNAARRLIDGLGVRGGRIVTLDGDMLASDTLLEQHEAMGAGVDLVLPSRVNLDEATTRGLDPERVLVGGPGLDVSAVQRRWLAARHRRAQWHWFLRKLGVGARHKPRLLGGHYSVTVELYERLNGFDELYQGWGFKDDEFARRAARLGASVRVAVNEIIGWHLYHPTRQAGSMRDLPTAARFRRRDLPVVAEHGLRNPLDQHPVRATVLGPERP